MALSIDDVTKAEGNGSATPFTFTVSLSSPVPAGSQVTVNYVTANGTAMEGSDYQSASGTLTFNPGQTSGQITVLVNGDSVKESNETFAVKLSSAVGASITDGQGLGTIQNDDGRPSERRLVVGAVRCGADGFVHLECEESGTVIGQANAA